VIQVRRRAFWPPTCEKSAQVSPQKPRLIAQTRVFGLRRPQRLQTA
jgi:hypothetical protein